MEKEKAKENLIALVKKFEKLTISGEIDNYLEEATKTNFIQPLLKDVLGWDVNDNNEVSPELQVSKGRVDYAIKLNSKIKIFVEAKKASEDLEKEIIIRQAVTYGYTYTKENVPVVILTSFETLKLYDVTIKPNMKNLSKGLKLNLHWKQYVEKFETLWALSKTSVINNSLLEIISRRPEEKRAVDIEILENLTEWKEILAKDIYKNNSNLFHSKDLNSDEILLKDITQKLLDRMMFIRFCEDRGLVSGHNLFSLFKERTESVGTNTIQIVLEREFKYYADTFDSDLFSFNTVWEKHLQINFKTLSEIVGETYSYMFSAVSVEILGHIYEAFLGYTLSLTDKQVRYEKKPDFKKVEGIYYTPQYIVEYIVNNTVGKKLKSVKVNINRNNTVVLKKSNLKILDPACGSGSFLIRAYDVLLEYYLGFKKKGKRKIHEKQTSFETGEGGTKLSINEKTEILTNHIFGIDIDKQAVEVTKLSLMLKMLEGESDIIKGRAILPMLNDNIKYGNSLIENDIYHKKDIGQKFTSEEKTKINAFDWKSSLGFKDIMSKGGFNCVLGNPPYITYALGRARDKNEASPLEYLAQRYPNSCAYKINSFAIFYEKAIELLNINSFCAFIVPGTLLINESLNKIRQHIIKNVSINTVVKLDYKVFKNAEMGDCCILVLYKDNNTKNYSIDTVYLDEPDFSKQQNDTIKKDMILNAADNRIYVSPLNYKFLTVSQNLQQLKDIAQFYNGIKTGDNKKFLSDTKLSDKYLSVVRGKDFTKYSQPKPVIYVLFDKDRLWSNTDESKLQVKPKILIRQTSDKIIATLDTKGRLVMDTVHIIYGSVIDLKVLLAIINSKLFNFLHGLFVPEKGKAFAEVKIANLGKIPVPKNISSEDKTLLIEYVESILSSVNESEKVFIEEKIDEIVYKLYDLSKKEIKLVEKSLKEDRQ
jgi:type I restriction-modification system DNA methylase subunit